MSIQETNIYNIGDQTSNGRLYSVIIKDLDLMFYIGIYDFEREKPQNVRINLEILAVEPDNMIADNYDDIFCYATIVNQIKKLSKQGHIELVETLAEKISRIILDNKQCYQAKVRIEKTNIIKETASVGVEILRTRG